MATKHDQILKHIEASLIGDRISVRSIAKSLSVSKEQRTGHQRCRKYWACFTIQR